MSQLAAQRCFHHGRREAAARCPSCQRTYCRECITEHENKVICASCLRQLEQPEATSSRSWAWLLDSVRLLAAILLLWILFYLLGRALLIMPDAFHDGTVWGGTG